MTATTCATPATTAPGTILTLRAATRDDVASIHALIARYQAPGRLLPRTEGEIARRIDRFYVVADGGAVVACAELAPLSAEVAEVRSLVVDEALRNLGLGRTLVEQLMREA